MDDISVEKLLEEALRDEVSLRQLKERYIKCFHNTPSLLFGGIIAGKNNFDKFLVKTVNLSLFLSLTSTNSLTKLSPMYLNSFTFWLPSTFL
jgi:hypothetical protein